MLTHIAGTPTFAVGEIASLPKHIEEAWIDAGYAERWDGEAPIETGAISAPERATRRRPKPRPAA